MLSFAAGLIMTHEPGDSRAVSDWAVAIAAAAAGDTGDHVMAVVRDASAKMQSHHDYQMDVVAESRR